MTLHLQRLKYRVRYDKIVALEIVRETEKMVVLAPLSAANSFDREVKEAKRSDWQNWFNSWEEAHSFLVKRAERKIENCRANLERAKGVLGQIKGMRPV